MRSALGLFLGQRGFAAPPPISAVAADGWQATIDGTPPDEYDPATSPKRFIVRRKGYAPDAAPAVVADQITLMKRVRLPYPDEATLTADQVALSDFIYADDEIADVANNSTRAYPTPVATWATPNYTRVDGTASVRLVVAHAHGRSGKPVAAVRFSATDGTTTVSETVSRMSSDYYPTSDLHAPFFEASLDLSTLDAGVVTVDAIIYPWVGEAFTVSVDGDTWPSANLAPLRLLNKPGTYGTTYAYVSPTGDDATGVAGDAQATAAAAPFATFSDAFAAIRAFNNTNYARNDASAGIVICTAGTITFDPFRFNVGTLAAPVEIVGAGEGVTFIEDTGSSTTGSLPPLTVWRNLTFRKNAAGNVIMLDNNNASDAMAIFDRVTFDFDGTAEYKAWVYRLGVIEAFDVTCAQPDTLGDFAGTKAIKAIGTTGINPDAVRSAVAMRSVGTMGGHGTGGQIVAHSYLNNAGSARALEISNEIGARGFALVGNVLESTGGSNPVASISADGVTTPVQNVVCQFNSFVGERLNWLYNDSGTVAVDKSGYLKGNVVWDFNIKRDTFAEDGALVGNWSEAFKVGAGWNDFLEGSSNGTGSDTVGVDRWLGEVFGLGERTGSNAEPLAADFADDGSQQGDSGGDGVYAPGVDTEIGAVSASIVPFTIDQNGVAIALAGSVTRGALQKRSESDLLADEIALMHWQGRADGGGFRGWSEAEEAEFEYSETVTSADALRTAVVGHRLSNPDWSTDRAVFICDWDGVSALNTEEDLPIYGPIEGTDITGLDNLDLAGAVRGGIKIRAATGRAPLIQGHLDIIGIPRLHVDGVGLTGTKAQIGTDWYARVFERNSVRPYYPRIAFTECPIGLGHAGAYDVANLPGGIIGECYSLHIEGCDLHGVLGTVVGMDCGRLRVWDNSMRGLHNKDFINTYGSLNDIWSGITTSAWVKGNVLWQHTNDDGQYGDFVQLSKAGSEARDGFKTLIEKNIVHTYSAGPGQFLQMVFGKNLAHDVAQRQDIVVRDNILVSAHWDCVRVSGQTGEDDIFIEDNLFVRAGEPILDNVFPRIDFAPIDGSDGGTFPQYGANGGTISIKGNYLTGIRGTANIASGALIEEGNVYHDPRDDTAVSGDGTSEAQAIRSEEVFALPGASRDVNDELKFANPEGAWTTRAEALAGIRTLVAPLAGWGEEAGPPDPETW